MIISNPRSTVTALLKPIYPGRLFAVQQFVTSLNICKSVKTAKMDDMIAMVKMATS